MRVVRIVVMTAATLGLAPTATLAALQVSPDLLADPSTRVSHDVAIRAWTEIPERLQTPTFGLHAARLIGTAAYDVVDHAIAHSPTMRKAIETLMRYQRLIHDANELRLEDMGHGEYRLSQRFRLAERVPVCLSDFITAQWVTRGVWLAGALPSVARVSISRPIPDDVSMYREIFSVPIEFGSELNAIWFDAAFLDRPIPHADVTLGPVLSKHADDLLAALPQASTLEQSLRSFVMNALQDGLPSVADAARSLGVSTRSLQRRLEEEGSSFKTVVDNVRKSLAMDYLRDGSRTVSEVAFLLGFSEVSAFSRAFKRWTGKSAVSFRRSRS